jgi:hypothetical protein
MNVRQKSCCLDTDYPFLSNVPSAAATLDLSPLARICSAAADLGSVAFLLNWCTVPIWA